MDAPQTPDFTKLITRVTGALTRAGFPCMIIGGQALLVHGQARLTEDIDIILGSAPDDLPRILEVCRELALVVLPGDVIGFVQDTFVLPAADPDTRVRVDFIFSSLPYERAAIGRAVLIDLDGTAVPFAAAEDLILHKLLAGRPRDFEDIQGIVSRKGDELDWDYLEEWGRELARQPGREEIPQQLTRIRR